MMREITTREVLYRGTADRGPNGYNQTSLLGSVMFGTWSARPE